MAKVARTAPTALETTVGLGGMLTIAREQAGIAPFLDQVQKASAAASDVLFWIVGVKPTTSERFKSEHWCYALCKTPDGNPRNVVLWDGIHRSPLNDAMAAQVGAHFAEGDAPPIGPVVMVHRTYSNEHGTFDSYNMREATTDELEAWKAVHVTKDYGDDVPFGDV